MPGVVLGTAAYMSPEQARGQPVDPRADIWSFGVLLMEMLTGRPVFAGTTVSEILAAVLRDEPDLASVPEGTPPALRRLLERCLRRTLKNRLQHIGDARLELEEAAEELTRPGPDPSDAPPPTRTRVNECGWRLTTEVCRQLHRDTLDPHIIGDHLEYLDNERTSDVVAMYLPGFGFDRTAFSDTVLRSPYRGIAVTPYGFEEAPRRRIPLPVSDHLTLLRLFLEDLSDRLQPRTTIVVGFSSGADLAMRLVAEGGVDRRHADGILALGPNLSLATCFFSRRVAEMPDGSDSQILDLVHEITGEIASVQEWLQMNPYLTDFARKYRSDIEALRAHGRDIVAPFRAEAENSFAGWYRAARDAGVAVRAVFSGSPVEQDGVRRLMMEHLDHGVLGPAFVDTDIANEGDLTHIRLLAPPVIEHHLAELLETLRAGG